MVPWAVFWVLDLQRKEKARIALVFGHSGRVADVLCPLGEPLRGLGWMESSFRLRTYYPKVP